MVKEEFYLLECYFMDACRGMKAIINDGEVLGFTKEGINGVQVQEAHPEAVRMVPEGV